MTLPSALGNLEFTKIHLRLKARLRLKPHIGHALLFRLELMHLPLHDFITSGKSHCTEPIIEQSGPVLAVFLQPCRNVVSIGIYETPCASPSFS